MLGLRHLAEGAPVALDGHHQRVVSEAAVAAGRVSDVALDHAAHDVLAAARSSDGCGADVATAGTLGRPDVQYGEHAPHPTARVGTIGGTDAGGAGAADEV